MNMHFAYLNGDVVPMQEARILVNDLGLWRGYGIFDYTRSYMGVPFHLDKYWLRFSQSAAALSLEMPITADELAEIIDELSFLQADRAAALGFRLVLTGGYTSTGILPDGAPNLLITTEPLPDQDPRAQAEGVSVITHEYQRYLPELKTTNYLPIYAQRARMQAAGAADILYCTQGWVTECTRNNFFIIKDDTLITADSGILYGITRDILLSLAPKAETRPLSLEEVLTADEAFKSGTTNGITPIVCIDRHVIGSGKPGRYTQQLSRDFEAYTQQYAASHKINI